MLYSYMYTMSGLVDVKCISYMALFSFIINQLSDSEIVIQGLKKIPYFPFGPLPFQSLLPDGQVIRQVVCQLSKKRAN